MPKKQDTDKIIRLLTKITAGGHSSDRIFEDWLLLCEATLNAIPGHAQAAAAGTQYRDTPETQKLFDAMRERYRNYFPLLSKAFGLLSSTAYSYQDTLGAVYMQFAYPNPHIGQYFTPNEVALLMAQIVSPMPIIKKHLQDAIAKSIPAQASSLVSLCINDQQARYQYFAEKILPAALPHYEPVTVLDPACGSGALLLAAASIVPPWINQLGLVQYYGIDIDRTCVRMAECNMMLHGLNGHYLATVLDISQTEYKRFAPSIPPAIRPIYDEARLAHANGDKRRVDEITQKVRRQTQTAPQHMSLF